MVRRWLLVALPMLWSLPMPPRTAPGSVVTSWRGVLLLARLLVVAPGVLAWAPSLALWAVGWLDPSLALEPQARSAARLVGWPSQRRQVVLFCLCPQSLASPCLPSLASSRRWPVCAYRVRSGA